MERSRRGEVGNDHDAARPQGPMRIGGGSVTAGLPVARRREVEIHDVRVMRSVLSALTFTGTQRIARDKDEADAARDETKAEMANGEWDPAYGRSGLPDQYARERGYIGEDQSWNEKQKDGSIKKKTLHHPDMKPASEHETKDGKKGTKMDMKQSISAADLAYIITDPNLQPDEQADAAAKASSMAGSCNEAFKTMDLDTLEAQAAFLAHSAVESRNWRTMTAQADPKAVGKFPGRGPLQVTFQQNQVKALAYLDAQAKKLEDGGRVDEAKKARAASAAIKKDPAAAADPQYAFLLSGALMHAAGGVERSAELAGKDPSFGGSGAEDGWMSGYANNDAKLAEWTAKKAAGNPDGTERVAYWEGVKKSSGRKNTAYDRAVERLSKHVLPADAPAPEPPP